MKKTLFIILAALCITSQLSAQTEGLAYKLIDGGKAYSVEKGSATAPEVVIPETYNRLPVREIAERGFYNYTQLSRISIPNSVTKINNRAFEQCSNLVNIQIPNSVRTIGSYAFAGCKSLPGLTIPDTVTSIGASAFKNCENLVSVNIPKSVTH
jgi:hypothetical protein